LCLRSLANISRGRRFIASTATANVLKAIRDLHPRDVIIRPDYVMINWFIPVYRIGLLGFRSGANQFSTFEYIDGLWFWNGNRSTEKKPTP
jgi:hypothetical protein